MATFMCSRLSSKACKNWNMLIIKEIKIKNSLNNINFRKTILSPSASSSLTYLRYIHSSSEQKYSSLKLKPDPFDNEFDDNYDPDEGLQIKENVEVQIPLLKEVKVSFLGGGKMAKALCEGLLSLGDIVASVSDINKQVHRPVKELGVSVTDDNKRVVRDSNVVILAVKPHIVPGVLDEVSSLVTKDHLVVSVAAGVTLESLSQMLPSGTRVIRTMPNTPSLVQCGATVFAPGNHATQQDCDLVKTLFSSVGICEQAQESHLDAVTGLSGSGPAYCFVAMEAMSDGAVKMGLPRELANKLAAQTMMGAAKMVLETGSHPGQLKDGVTSPGGTTITALHALERAGFRASLIDAVEAATLRSRELGKK